MKPISLVFHYFPKSLAHLVGPGGGFKEKADHHTDE